MLAHLTSNWRLDANRMTTGLDTVLPIRPLQSGAQGSAGFRNGASPVTNQLQIEPTLIVHSLRNRNPHHRRTSGRIESHRNYHRGGILMQQQFEIDNNKKVEDRSDNANGDGNSLASQILQGQDHKTSGSWKSGKPGIAGYETIHRQYYTYDENPTRESLLSSRFGKNVKDLYFEKWDTDESGDLSKKELGTAQDNSTPGSAENAAATVLLENFKEATDMATAMNPILLSRLSGDFFGAPLYEQNFGNDWKSGISKKDFIAMNNASYRAGVGRVYYNSIDMPVLFGSLAVSMAFTGAAAVCNVVPQWNAYSFPLLAAAFVAQVPMMRMSLRWSEDLYTDQVKSRSEKLDRWFQNYAYKHG